MMDDQSITLYPCSTHQISCLRYMSSSWNKNILLIEGLIGCIAKKMIGHYHNPTLIVMPPIDHSGGLNDSTKYNAMDHFEHYLEIDGEQTYPLVI